MSIRRKWLLTACSLVAIGVILVVAIGYHIMLYGARRGSYEWLRASHARAIPKLNASHLRQLTRDASVLAGMAVRGGLLAPLSAWRQ